MKKLLNSLMLAAVAAAAFASCQNIETEVVSVPSSKMKTIKVYTDLATKTTLDANHENLVWSTGDKISLFNDQNNTNAQLTYEAAGYMVVEVPDGTTEVYGHYPYYSDNTSGPESVSVYISKNQTQTNPGELNGFYYPMVAKGTVTDDKAEMQFYPVASALAINLYHTGLAGSENVTKVKVTPTANANFIGQQIMNLTNDNLQYTATNSSDETITVTLSNVLALGDSKPADSQKFNGQIYACLARQSYTAVTFEITTDKGIYTITSNGTAIDCTNKDFVPVNINLDKATFTPVMPEPVKTGYFRVESAFWLNAGDRVAIVAAGYDKAMSTTQNSNNRGEVAITKSTEDGYSKLTINETVQLFDVVEGSVSGTFAFKCVNGGNANNYIYAASSSSNYLRSQDTKDANASFTLVVADGVATLKAQGTNTHNWLRYNNSNTCFSCYGSGQNDVSIYKSYSLPSLGSLTITATPDHSAKTITVAWSDVEHATNYAVECTGQDTKNIAAGVGTATFTALEYGTEYTLKVTASAEGYDPSVSNEEVVTLVNPAAKTVTRIKESIDDVAAAGVADETETGVYELANGATDGDLTVTYDETVVTAASASDGNVTYTVPANTGAARDGWIKIAVDGGNTIQIDVHQLAGSVDYSPVYTSNVTITAGSNAQAATIVINETDYSGIKAGTGSKKGSAKVTVPSGSTKLYVHIAGWNGEGGKTINVSPTANISKINGVTTTSLTTVADSGVSGSSPFTLAGTAQFTTGYFFEIDLTDISSNTDITFEAGVASNNRFVIWGCNAK